MKRILTALFVLLVSTFSLHAQLSGTYTIGATGNYTTIAAAIADLNTNGVSGPVIFSLTDETYAETGANLVISVSTNAPTLTNTVTFKPATGITPEITITGCATSSSSGTQADTAKRQAGFTISNTSYITIDGSNTNGGSTKDLTFIMNDGTNGIQAINLWGNCDNVIIKNIIITYSSISTSTSTRGIYCNGQWPGVVDSLIVNNCDIANATTTPYYAVSVTGSSTYAKYCTGIHITNNNLYGRIRPVYFFYVGTSTSTCSVENNVIRTPGGTNGTTTYFMLMNTWNGYVLVQNNQFPTLSTNNTTTSGIFGFSALAAQTSTDCRVYNNFFGSDIVISGSGVPTVTALMYLQDNGVYKVYHNTFHLPSNVKGTNKVCLYVSGTSVNATVTNNIFLNSTDSSNSYCIYKTSSGTLTSNYNCLYPQGTLNNVGFLTSARKTLSDWQTASSQDADSKSKAVTFASSTDLHLSGASIGDLDLIGVTGLGIATDIDGDTRSGSFPYMGADEASTPLPAELTSFTATSKNGNVELVWTTATENNNAGFEVERRVGSSWSKVGFVEGAGTSNTPREYRFSDAVTANGSIGYRLKQIDRSGHFTYSNVVEVVITQVAQSYMLNQNYPNPFNPSTTISFSVPNTEHATVKVYDVAGKEVATLFNAVAQSGETYNVQFNASNLASGMYLYVLQTQNNRVVKRMTLLK